MVITGVPIDIGEIVTVVIAGNGPAGTFTGRLVGVNSRFVRLILATAAGNIPAGTLVAINRNQIAAVARLGVTTTGVRTV